MTQRYGVRKEENSLGHTFKCRLNTSLQSSPDGAQANGSRARGPRWRIRSAHLRAAQLNLSPAQLNYLPRQDSGNCGGTGPDGQTLEMDPPSEMQHL